MSSPLNLDVYKRQFEYNMQNNTENDILQLPEKIAIEKGIQIVISVSYTHLIATCPDKQDWI